jgi:alanyl-tRNA synthetase
VGEIVNQRILQAIDLKEETGVSLDEATARGAMALFGEKYGETVRVITFDPEFSVELCGGTHISNSAQIGSFFVTAETGVAAGVRRIEAVGGQAALRFVSDRMAQWQQIHETLRSPRNLPEQVQRLQQELASMRKELERRNEQALSGILKELSTQYVEYSGMRFLMKVVELDQVDHLKKLAGGLVNQCGLSAVVLGAIHSEKANVAIAINPTLSGLAGLTSGRLAKEAGAILGGSGGGSPQLAMAGGPEKTKLNEALNFVNEQLLAHINAK